MTTSATDWESHYRDNDMPWDKGMSQPGLVEYLKTSPLLGRILVPGCGLGHDVRALAAAGGSPVGWDIAPSAVAAARSIAPVGSESYELQDLFAPPADQLGTFDAAFEHTCFCAIDPSLREKYVNSLTRLLRPCGTLVAIFYVNPAHGGDGPPYGCSHEELDRLFSPSFRLLHQEADFPTFPGREGREVFRVLQKMPDFSNRAARLRAYPTV